MTIMDREREEIDSLSAWTMNGSDGRVPGLPFVTPYQSANHPEPDPYVWHKTSDFDPPTKWPWEG